MRKKWLTARADVVPSGNHHEAEEDAGPEEHESYLSVEAVTDMFHETEVEER